jgi:23S rRNA pseudouridine2605 synthase
VVKIDGKIIKPSGKMYYIMLNKPVGYVTTVKDQFERPTVIDLVGTEISERIFPVGRLDYETEGLLLLTNDGDFTYKVTHPKHNIEKTYIAVLDRPIGETELEKFRTGVTLADGYECLPAQITPLTDDGLTVEIKLREGKYHQIKRMAAACGSHVNKLRRVSMGSLELDSSLAEGECRLIGADELAKIKIG